MAVATVDHYRILGVDETASAEQVRSAFRRAAKAHHPDRNPGDPDAALRFRRIHEAYEVLGDPERRAAYCRPPAPPPPGWANAYAASRRTADAVSNRDRSAAAELGEALALLTVAATVQLERRLRQFAKYLDRL